jgi:hypothetical protein
MAIAADGAAFDQVPASGAGCPTTDQRGDARPKGAACDIGAFEADPLAPVLTGTALPGGPAGGTPGGPPGGNAPAGETPAALAVRLLLRTQRLLAVLASGYVAEFDTNKAGTGVLEIFVDGKATRGLTTAARKRVRVARGSRSLGAAGRSTVTARFTRTAKRVLAKRKTVKVIVTLTVTDASGAKSVKSLPVTLRR